MSCSTICADIDRSKFSAHNVTILRRDFPHLDDSTLARYLVAKNDNFISAVKQLTKAESLKKDHWHIQKEECLDEISKGSAYIHGHDKEGRPLIIIHARMHDPVNRNLKESVLMTLWWTELAISQLPAGKSRFTILLDRSNCENALDTEYMTALAEIFMDLHPERLERAIVYPTGLVYYSLWNVVLKWFMEEHTRDKVVPAISLSDVQALIPDEFIPASLGGSSQYVYRCEDFSDPVYPPEISLANCANGNNTVFDHRNLFSATNTTTESPVIHESRTDTPVSHYDSGSNSAGSARTGPAPTSAVLRGSSGDSQPGRCMRSPSVAIEELLEIDETRTEPDQLAPTDSDPLGVLAMENPGHTDGRWDANAPQQLPQHRTQPAMQPLNVSYVPAQEFRDLSKSSETQSFRVATELHPLSSPAPPAAPQSKDQQAVQAKTGEESGSEEFDDGVWNDVDSVVDNAERRSNYDVHVDGFPVESPARPPAIDVADAFPAEVEGEEVELADHVDRTESELLLSPLSNSINNSTDASHLHSGLSTSESYHYNAPPVPLSAVRPVQLFPLEGAPAADASDDDDTCLEFWHEVGSVIGQVDQDNDTFSGAGAGMVGVVGPGANPAIGLSEPAAAQSGIHTVESTLGSEDSVVSLSTRTVFAHLLLTTVWCSLVVAAVGAGLYFAYNPTSVTITVSGTVLAQLMLLVLLFYNLLRGREPR